MAARSLLLAACAVLCLLAPLLSTASVASQEGHFAASQRGHVLHNVRRQLLEEQADLKQNLEARSTRRLQESEASVPLVAGGPHTVTLPVLSSLSDVLLKIVQLLEDNNVFGHFPFESFSDLGVSSNRFGFAPTNDSFCLFASNGRGTPGSTADAPSAALSSSTGSYPGPGIPNYAGGPVPYYNGQYAYGTYGRYNIIDLRGEAPAATFPYGLPPKLANILNVFGAELTCLLGPILPPSTPPFPVFLEVLLEDALAVFGQFLKVLSPEWAESPALNSDLLLLRDPFNPWGSPLKFEFSLTKSDFGITTPPSYYPPSPESTPASAAGVNPGISPVAAVIPPGDYVRAVAYDGYLDSCQIILGSLPGSDGTFDRVNDFAGAVTDGAWSVDLTILANSNNSGDVAYIVPAAKSNAYGQLTLESRKSAGYCYDIATLLPVYNPLAVPVPDDMDIANSSLAASAISTVLVFGNAFGLDEPGLKTAFGIDQIYDFTLWDGLDAAQNDPYGPGAHIYRENIKIQNVVTLGANLMANDSSTYASFAVLLYQAVARAAVGATNLAASQNFANLNGPALNLDSATTIQDIYYGAKAWVGTTSDPTLPSAQSNADARIIYATALAANNLNALTDHAQNASGYQKTAYYTQAVVVPQLESVLAGEASVDDFMSVTTYDALWSSLEDEDFNLPGSISIPPAVIPTVPVTTDPTAQADASRGTSSGLSGGAIAGIVIGCVVGAALIAAAAAFTTKHLRERHYARDDV